MNAMTEDVVMEILGEQFQEYDELYDGDETLLKKEAVGKMVAQNIVDRNGLHDDIRFISGKVLDKIKSNLKNGSEHDIDRIIMQLDGDINDFVNYIFGREESIDLFDKNLIDQFKDRLYFVRNKMRTVQDIAEKNYNITAKRMKLLSLKRKDYKLTKEEMRQFDNMRQLMEKKDYSNACLEFIKYTLEDCKSVYNNIESLRDDYNNGRINGLKLLKGAAGALRQADDLIQAYENPIQSMQSIGSIQDVASQLPAEDIEELQNLASETVRVINDIKGIVSDLRMNILAKLLENYWGKDKKIRLSDGTETSLTLYDVLESNVGETFSVSRLLNSLADAGDPMLQLMDMMFKDFTNQRDKHIFSLQQELATIQSDYMKKTGSRDMRVLYVRDQDGKFTGMLKSDRDYLRFHKEKREYRQ